LSKIISSGATGHVLAFGGMGLSSKRAEFAHYFYFLAERCLWEIPADFEY
jgi:hypothetical protein